MTKIDKFYLKECERYYISTDWEPTEEQTEFYNALLGYHLRKFEELILKKANYLRDVRTFNFKDNCYKLFCMYLGVFEKYHNFKLEYNMQKDNFSHFLELVELI